MNKIKNFDSKTTYVSPSMKQVLLGTRANILTGSYGEDGQPGPNGYYNDYNDDDDL